MADVSDNAAQRSALRAEVDRIHESAVYSAQGQYEAAKRWRFLHWTFGVAAAVLGTASATLTFAADTQLWSGLTAVAAALIAATMTGVRYDRLAERAQAGGNDYTALRNDARRLRDIAVPIDDVPVLRQALTAIAVRASDLDRTADPIPRWAYSRAKRNIEDEGGQSFRADQL